MRYFSDFCILVTNSTQTCDSHQGTDSTGPVTPPPLSQKLVQHIKTVFDIPMISSTTNRQHPFPNSLPVQLSLKSLAFELSGRWIQEKSPILPFSFLEIIKLFLCCNVSVSVNWLQPCSRQEEPVGWLQNYKLQDTLSTPTSYHHITK